jgi:hypothetical protein
VSRFYADANLYEAPAVRRSRGVGRPRQKGRKLARPEQGVTRTRRRTKLRVSWYGGGRRRVEAVSGTGGWYRSWVGRVPIRWVYVHDLSGTHRGEYFFTAAVAWKPATIIQVLTGRGSIEVTFAEMRAYVGLETTRGWKPTTVLRMTVEFLWFHGIGSARLLRTGFRSELLRRFL